MDSLQCRNAELGMVFSSNCGLVVSPGVKDQIPRLSTPVHTDRTLTMWHTSMAA